MREVMLHIPKQCEEAVSAFLAENGVIPAIINGFWDQTEKTVFYLDEEWWGNFKPHLLKKLNEVSRIFGTPPPILSERPLEAKEWQDAWKRYTKIYRFGQDLIIKPTWRKLRKNPACPVISIDPETAFGTGGHASTRLCIRQMLFHRKRRPEYFNEVLDMGTGSGILAIVAACLGARYVLAVDIDQDVLPIARANAEKNGVADIIEFRKGSIGNCDGYYDLILANINEGVLSNLLKGLRSLLKPDGILVVSGILREQENMFLEKATRNGLKRLTRRSLKEWVSFSMMMRKSHS